MNKESVTISVKYDSLYDALKFVERNEQKFETYRTTMKFDAHSRKWKVRVSGTFKEGN